MCKSRNVGRWLVFVAMLVMASCKVHAQIVLPVVQLEKADLKTIPMLGGYPWKKCGKYFAAVDTEHGRNTHFNYAVDEDGRARPRGSTWATETLTIMISKAPLYAPQVAMINHGDQTWIAIKMSLRQYREALPCITDGTPM